jgi:hypothetical protein
VRQECGPLISQNIPYANDVTPRKDPSRISLAVQRIVDCFSLSSLVGASMSIILPEISRSMTNWASSGLTRVKVVAGVPSPDIGSTPSKSTLALMTDQLLCLLQSALCLFGKVRSCPYRVSPLSQNLSVLKQQK